MSKVEAGYLSKVCFHCHVGTYQYYTQKLDLLKCTTCGHTMTEEQRKKKVLDLENKLKKKNSIIPNALRTFFKVKV